MSSAPINASASPQHYYQLAERPTEKMERIEQAEAFFANTKADIRVGGNMAYYACQADYVQMPTFETFTDAESHSATLAHEVAHWTHHPTRLNCEIGRKRWGDEGYAMEELVAEVSSSFLCADLGTCPRFARITLATSSNGSRC